MNTIFVGGSRRVSRLPGPARERIKNIVSKGDRVIVGDAAGADKAVQKMLHDAGYDKVTVFCSGENPRNNLGAWPVERIAVGGSVKGFQFFAEKDREMARRGDFGLMIWDGQSVGTLLNVLRLIRADKKAVLIDAMAQKVLPIKSVADWLCLIKALDQAVVDELRAKSTPQEWVDVELPPNSTEAPTGLVPTVGPIDFNAGPSDESWPKALEKALGAGDVAGVVAVLGSVATERGMSTVAKRAGLPLESLKQALDRTGAPNFATVLCVIRALDIRIAVALNATAKSAGRKPRKQKARNTIRQPDLIPPVASEGSP